MIAFGAVLIALVVVGAAIARTLWRKLDGEDTDPYTPAEFINAAGVISVSLWIGLNWILGLTQTFNRVAIAGAALMVIIGAAVIAFRNRELARLEMGTGVVREWAFLLPILPWTAFILWRGRVLPPCNHDALAYHLPKAVLLMRAGGFERFDAPDMRVANFPFNYEYLLADVLLLTGSDRITEWIGTASFVAVLVVTAALAQRWSPGQTLGTVGAVLATSTAPVMILHSGADKNDLMTAWFGASALLWGGRWFVSGGRMPLLLTIICVGVGIGTKSVVASMGLALAPFLAVRAIRGWRQGTIRAADVARVVGAASLVLALGGGAAYVSNFLARATQAAPTALPERVFTSTFASVQYGDWNNFWQVPYLLLTIPFSNSTWGVWVPWDGKMWFWPHYEIFFSHYGRVLTILALLSPFAWWWRRRGDRSAGREQRVAVAAALLAVAVMLPVQMRPVGFFGAFARYFAFIVPVTAALTVPPIIAWLSARSAHAARLTVGALSAVFVFEAVACAIHDRFAPIEYVMYASRNPGTRMVWFIRDRAASVVDVLAGPDETIAVDGAFDTWTHPAYGAHLTRPVVFLKEGSTPNEIPPAASWVIIDRSWNALWNNRNFRNMGQMTTYIGRGTPSPGDVFLLKALARDRRFRLVYRNPVMNQAVFRRVTPTR